MVHLADVIPHAIKRLNLVDHLMATTHDFCQPLDLIHVHLSESSALGQERRDILMQWLLNYFLVFIIARESLLGSSSTIDTIVMFPVDQLDDGSRIVWQAFSAHGYEVVSCIDSAGYHLNCWLIIRGMRVIYFPHKLHLICDRLCDDGYARDGCIACNTSLKFELDEFEGAWFLVSLDPVQVLFETVNKDHVHSLTMEKLCEENLNRFAVVEHRTLLHNPVHCLENDVFNQDLLLQSFFHRDIGEGINQCHLENLVAGWIGRGREVFKDHLAVITHVKFV